MRVTQPSRTDYMLFPINLPVCVYLESLGENLIIGPIGPNP